MVQAKKTKITEKKAVEKKEATLKAKEKTIAELYDILKYPLSTEKSIRQIEFDNKLVFVVNPRATKNEVKEAVEKLFKVKVISVNIQNSFAGQKRAFVRLSLGSSASDVSADLGLI